MSVKIIVECPHCEKKLRLTARRKSLGNEVEGTCGRCFRTTLPTLSEINMNEDDLRQIRPLLEELGDELPKAMDNPAITGIIERIRSIGYDPFVIMEVLASINQETTQN